VNQKGTSAYFVFPQNGDLGKFNRRLAPNGQLTENATLQA